MKLFLIGLFIGLFFSNSKKSDSKNNGVHIVSKKPLNGRPVGFLGK